MNKEGDVKFLKIQTCVLRVNIHCDGCKQKVKKLLHKIDGVYTTTIDSELGKVTVSGDVDPATLIRKLVKAGKHAELWSAPKGGNMMNNNKQLNKQFQNMQLDNKKGQKDAKPPKGGGKDNQKNLPPLPPQMQHPLQQSKGFKDLKLPPLKGLTFPFNKDQKTVKFASQEDEDFSDDEFDDEEELDEFDDDFDDEVAIKPQSFKGIPMKPPMSGQVPVQGHPFMNVPPNPAMNAKGGGGNGNKNVQVPITGGGNNDGKNDGGGKKGGGNNSGGNQNPNQHQNGSGGKNGGKNGGGNIKNAPNNMPNGGAGNNHHPQEGKKGGGGGGGAPQKGGAGQGGFHEIDLRKNGGGGDMVGGPAGQMGYYAGMPAAGQMAYPGMPPAGNMPAVQGMPMNAGGNFRPEMMASGGANPYQQQMLAQMTMQQHQRHNAGFQPMTYARPPPAVAYAPPYMPPPHYCPPTPEYTHYFSDENTNSCTVM